MSNARRRFEADLDDLPSVRRPAGAFLERACGSGNATSIAHEFSNHTCVFDLSTKFLQEPHHIVM